MKIALYIEDGLEQLVLTPESKYEQNMLQLMHDNTRELSIRRGKFFENMAGYVIQGETDPITEFGYAHMQRERPVNESTMLILRPKEKNDGR